MAKARVASLAVAAAHATLVVVSTLGFFVFEPLVGVVATNGAWQDSALDIVLSVLHGLVCLVPVWLVALSRGGRLTRGLKQAITASCAVAVLVQALRLACLAYVAAAAATALGSWLATLIALALDVVVLLALLTLSMTSRLDSVSGAQRPAKYALLMSVAHFLASAAAFLVVANVDVDNAYLEYAGGLSVLYAVMLFLGGALFPGFCVYLRSTLDGQLSLVECVVACLYLVPWVALDASLIVVAQTLVDGPMQWQMYFAFIAPSVDTAVCVALAAAIVHKCVTLRVFDPEAVSLVPGSAARHNDLS